MRLVSWNIHSGVGLDGKCDLTRIAEEILALDPDVVCLQEVAQRLPGTGNQPKVLQNLCDMSLTFGHETRYLGCAFGNAILTHYKVIKISRHRLQNRHERMRPGLIFEHRGALEVEMEMDGHLISIFSTHWSLRREDRLESAKQLGKVVSRIDHPVVLAGDFNTALNSEEVEILMVEGRLSSLAGISSLVTFPSGDPKVGIDHVLVRGFGGAVKIIPTSASDHCIVCADLCLRVSRETIGKVNE